MKPRQTQLSNPTYPIMDSIHRQIPPISADCHHLSPFVAKGDASEVSRGMHDTQHPVIQRLFPSFPSRRESKSSIRHVRVRNDLPNVTILALEIKPSTIVQVVDLAIRA